MHLARHIWLLPDFVNKVRRISLPRMDNVSYAFVLWRLSWLETITCTSYWYVPGTLTDYNIFPRLRPGLKVLFSSQEVSTPVSEYQWSIRNFNGVLQPSSLKHHIRFTQFDGFRLNFWNKEISLFTCGLSRFDWSALWNRVGCISIWITYVELQSLLNCRSGINRTVLKIRTRRYTHTYIYN